MVQVQKNCIGKFFLKFYHYLFMLALSTFTQNPFSLKGQNSSSTKNLKHKPYNIVQNSDKLKAEQSQNHRFTKDSV